MVLAEDNWSATVNLRLGQEVEGTQLPFPTASTQSNSRSQNYVSGVLNLAFMDGILCGSKLGGKTSIFTNLLLKSSISFKHEHRWQSMLALTVPMTLSTSQMRSLRISVATDLFMLIMLQNDNMWPTTRSSFVTRHWSRNIKSDVFEKDCNLFPCNHISLMY